MVTVSGWTNFTWRDMSSSIRHRYRGQAQASTFVLSGRLLNPTHFLTEIDVFYEPLPKAPDIFWLRVPRSVSLPDDYITLRPRAPDGMTYTDGSRGGFRMAKRSISHELEAVQN